MINLSVKKQLNEITLQLNLSSISLAWKKGGFFPLIVIFFVAMNFCYVLNVIWGAENFSAFEFYCFLSATISIEMYILCICGICFCKVLISQCSLDWYLGF